MKKKSQLNDDLADLADKITDKTPVEDTTLVHAAVTDEGITAAKSDDNSDADSDGEEAFGGDTAALTSDDDVDELGEKYGVKYHPKEELDVTKKVDIQTGMEPPEPEKPRE
jgi:hypothetical protein